MTDSRKVNISSHTVLDNPRGLAVLDVSMYSNGQIITRINVPEPHRGKGVARDMLKRTLERADEYGVTLYLEVLSSDGLTRQQLIDWYERHGFVEFMTGMWRRKPRTAYAPCRRGRGSWRRVIFLVMEVKETKV